MRGSNPKFVQRTGDAPPSLPYHVCINHGRLHVAVPEQVLDGADVGSAFQQVGGEGVTKRVHADPLCQTDVAGSRLDGLVDHAGINVMPAEDPGARINGETPGGKHVLPSPFFGGPGIFLAKALGR